MIHHSLTHTRTKLWASWRPFPHSHLQPHLPRWWRVAEKPQGHSRRLSALSALKFHLFFRFFTAHGNLSFKLCGRTTSWCQLAAENEEAETVLEPSAGAWWDFSSGRGEADSSCCQAVITHTYRSMCESTYNTTHSLRRRINTSNIFLQWSNCELKYDKCLLYACVCTTWQRQHYELVKQR